jgi:hypothetical protein
LSRYISQANAGEGLSEKLWADRHEGVEPVYLFAGQRRREINIQINWQIATKAMSRNISLQANDGGRVTQSNWQIATEALSRYISLQASAGGRVT